MKKLLIPITWMLIAISVKSQAPGLLNYQGVARNSVGNVLVNKAITLRLSIREGSGGGTLVYQETRSVVTNPFGLFNIQIGSPGASSTTGTIAGTNWSSGSKFIQVEIDPNGGNAFINIGAAQLAAVPYALHASSAFPIGNAGGSLTGLFPNPIIANAAVIQAMIAPGVTLPPSGPAGGSLSGIYPNPLIANAAVLQAMIAPGVTLPPSGPAGGSLSGNFPNPIIANGAIIQSMLAPGVSLPPAGAAGGDLGGTYPNPGVNRIRGINVSTTAPNSNFVLGYDGTSWSPTNLAIHPDNYWRMAGGAIYNANPGAVGLGTNNPASSAKLEVQSTSSGFLMPRMTEAQRNTIASPATGLMIFQTDNEPGFYFYNGSAWTPLNGVNGGSDSFWLENSPGNISSINTGNVGIGTSDPTTKLHIRDDGQAFKLEGANVYMSFLNSNISTSGHTAFIGLTGSTMYMGTPASNSDGDLRMFTNGFPRLNINSNGNVGIGTTLPQSALHIFKDNEAFRIEGDDTYMSFFEGGDRLAMIGTSFNNLGMGTAPTNADGSVYLYTRGLPRMRISAGGNVGIGTSSPQSALHITRDGEALRIEGANSFMSFENGVNRIAVIGHENTDLGIGTISTNTTGGINIFTQNQSRFYINSTGRARFGPFFPSFLIGSTLPEFTVNGSFCMKFLDEWVFYPASTLNVIKNGITIAFVNNDGEWNDISDRSLKTNFNNYHSTLGALLKLEVLTYDYKSNPDGAKTLGLIAQDVQKYFPEIVSENKESKHLGIAYSKTGVLAIKAIQEQQVIIETLEAKLELLEKRLALLEARLK